MRIFLSLVIALEVIALVLVLALWLVVPRVVQSDAVRTRIESAAQDALGRELRYSRLGFGYFPPSLIVVEPSVAGAAEGDAPFVEADAVSLRIALLPLLARAVVVDSLVIEGAVLRLRRNAEGIELPRPPVRDEPEQGRDAPAPPSDTQTSEPEGPPVDLAVRSFSLRRARIVFEDLAVSPAATVELRDLDLTARIDSLDAPIDFDAAASLSHGGKLALAGTASLDGALDVELVLEQVDLAAARPYLGDGLEVAGVVSGTVKASGPAASLTSLRAELAFPDARVTMDEITLAGPLTVVADMEGDLATPNGRFEVDASQADLRYGGAFRKQPGKPATVKGRIVTGDDGRPGIDDLELEIGNARVRGQVAEEL